VHRLFESNEKKRVEVKNYWEKEGLAFQKKYSSPEKIFFINF